MAKEEKKENLILSWKEIAAYLDGNVRTCLRWEKKYGLPVHRIDPTSRSTVFAYKEELDTWLEKKNKKNGAVKSKRRGFIFLFFISFLVLICAAGFYFLFLKNRSSQTPADFRIKDSTFIVLNEEGKELWTYDTGIQELVDEDAYRDHFQSIRTKYGERMFPQLAINDMNNDGRAEVLFSTQTESEFGEGELLCFNHKGKSLWKFSSGRQLKFGPKIYSPDYRIKGFLFDDIDEDGNLEIILVASQKTFFPTQLVVLDSEGQITGEYWNSGRFTNFALIDLDDDGTKEIIAVGCNNEYGKGCCVIFDPRKVTGSSPQSGFYKCDELKPGSEKYYTLFPRTEVDINDNPVEIINHMDILKNRRLSFTTSHSNIIYELDYNLKLQDVRLSHYFERRHKLLFDQGRIKKELNKEELRERLSKGLLYYDGKDWISEPTMNLQREK